MRAVRSAQGRWRSSPCQLHRRKLFVEAANALPSATGFIQEGLLSFKNASDMSWCGTFACSTLIVRASLLPFVRLQMLENKKLAKAMPELNFLVQLVRERLNSPTSDGQPGSPTRGEETIRTLSVFRKGVNACLIIHDVSVMRILMPPVLNISMFITFVMSVRGMIRGGNIADMETGGMLWFENLTIADPTYALPLIAVGASYSALEYGFSSPDEQSGDPNKGRRLSVTLKDVFQTILLMSVPFVTQLPAGIFAYWIPSSLAGILQTYGVRALSAKERLAEQEEAALRSKKRELDH